MIHSNYFIATARTKHIFFLFSPITAQKWANLLYLRVQPKNECIGSNSFKKHAENFQPEGQLHLKTLVILIR